MRKLGVFFNMPLARQAEVWNDPAADDFPYVVKTYIRGEFQKYDYFLAETRLEADEWAVEWVNENVGFTGEGRGNNE